MTNQTSMTLASPSTEFRPKYNWLRLLEEHDDPFVAVDTETNGKQDVFINGNGRVNGFSLGIRMRGHYFSDYFPVGHVRGNNLDEREWRPILDKVIKSKVAVMVNANYDRLTLSTIGYKPEYPFIDLGKFVVFEDENWKQAKKLENIGQKYIGQGKTVSPEFEMLLKVWGWDKIASHEIREYGGDDALVTIKSFYAVYDKIAKRGEESVVDYWNKIDRPNFDVLYKMRDRGILVDIPKCRAMEEKGMARMEEIKEELGFNPGEKKALQKTFYEDLKLPVIMADRKKKDGTKTQTPTLNKDAMERYDLLLAHKNNKVAKLILEYRGWEKAVSSYYRSYQNHVYPDGRIRTDYNSGGTVTGRYSSSNPNLQQIPKETDKPWNGEVKSVFKARPGYELWEFDYSQLEFRLSAHFSRDPKLIEIFSQVDRDIFTEMAQALGMSRQDCKQLTYSILYGAGRQRVMDLFGISAQAAQDRIDSFYSTYPGMRAVSNFVSNKVRQTGKIRLWSGRYRHFNNKSEAHKAFNSYIQGGAADLVKHVMNRIDKEYPELDMLLQIHDSIVFEIPKDKVSYYKPRIEAIMENPVEEIDWRIKFKVDGERMGAK